MIEVNILFIYKSGERKEETRTFYNKISALRFMYGIERKGHLITGWKCEHVEDHEYLSKRFYLKHLI